MDWMSGDARRTARVSGHGPLLFVRSTLLDSDLSFHVGVIAAVKLELSGSVEDSPLGYMGRKLHVPFAIPSRRGVGDEIRVHPLDRIADMGCPCRRRENQPL